MNTQIIAIANQKGGVGKTTTCANLGIGLAQAGKKVLLIDGDPQGSLTISLGHPQPDKLPFTLSDAMGRILMDEPLRPGEGILHHPEGVDLMPADIQLSGMEVSLVNAMSRETILRQYLDTLKGQYSHILGIVLEKPQSAYDIQKDVEYHHFSRWTKISVPSIYRKVLQMSEKGYLQSDIVKGGKFADKAIYSITDKGRVYFKELMAFYASGPIPLLFDFNVVITNLNKMDKAEAMELVSTLRQSIQSSAELNEGYAQEFADIPLVGRTIFEQQQLLYNALLEWLKHFEGQFLQE